jgi:Protein phosphatase inhibitor
MQRMREREETPTSGSQTITATTSGEERVREETPVVLHLHAVPSADERRVTWDEEVVDNENMGKKSSKGMYPLYVC